MSWAHEDTVYCHVTLLFSMSCRCMHNRRIGHSVNGRRERVCGSSLQHDGRVTYTLCVNDKQLKRSDVCVVYVLHCFKAFTDTQSRHTRFEWKKKRKKRTQIIQRHRKITHKRTRRRRIMRTRMSVSELVLQCVRVLCVPATYNDWKGNERYLKANQINFSS